ncbi:MAG: ADP-ribosylglycohydrolase family protein [Deltaproteobacteria bacterium]|nr:ADP-ribosylglycohydrolase family protein [Deltaproteobacteria bacterium]
MLGAIAGDIIGSVYERLPIKTKRFELFTPGCRFTDDSVLTVAVAEAVLSEKPYRDCLLDFGRRYPDAGYGGWFFSWLHAAEPRPYHSFGNGSAMRVSPVGFAFDSLERVCREARRSAEVTHDHPEGIKGAQAVAACIWLARRGSSKQEIREQIQARFGYDLSASTDAIRPTYSFDVTCQGTLPPALAALLDSCSWEDAVRNAISLGGDSDTLGCITGGMAQAFYGGIPDEISEQARTYLPSDLLDVVDRFYGEYM